MIKFSDVLKPTDIRITRDGYLVGQAPVARTGIQLYAGAEVGRPDLDLVRVYRPPEQVFSQDSMSSYAFRPITVDHPSNNVDAGNWAQLSVGTTGGEVMRDGERVVVPLVLMDQGAINAYQQGTKQISMGYEAELEFVDGVTPNGENYDAIQKNLRMNHLALVQEARGGPELSLGHFPTTNLENSMTDSTNNLRTVMVDGLSVQTTDAGAQAIERLQNDVQKLTTQLSDQQSASDQTIAERDSEIAQRDTRIEELEKQVVDGAALDQLVASRAQLVSDAKRVHDADYAGLNDEEIRRTAVEAVVGKDVIDGKSPAYIEARFDTLLENASDSNGGGNNRGSGNVVTLDRKDNEDAQKVYEDRLRDAWKNTK